MTDPKSSARGAADRVLASIKEAINIIAGDGPDKDRAPAAPDDAREAVPSEEGWPVTAPTRGD